MKECDKCGPVNNDLIVFSFRDKALICENCISELNSVVDKKYNKKPEQINKDSESGFTIPSMGSMIKYLNRTIIGQNKAKETTSIAIRNHYKRMKLHPSDKKIVEKSNILLMGHSGTGKTAIIKSLASFIDVPCIIADASIYTSYGYVGSDVSEIITDLYEKSGKNKEKTEKGIVFLDEIDKKRKSKDRSGQVEPGGEQAQQALLKLVEGTTVKVDRHTVIDTTDILFIAGGAFVGIEDVVKQRFKSKNGIGFHDREGNQKTQKSQYGYNDVSTEDLIEYGMTPEFVGRFPQVTYTDDLTKEDIVNIIKKTDNSVLKQYKALLKVEDGLELEVTNQAIHEISQRVVQDKIGVRGVRKVFDHVLHNVQFKAEDIKKNGGVKIKVTKETINNNSLPDVRNNEGEKVNIEK